MTVKPSDLFILLLLSTLLSCSGVSESTVTASAPRLEATPQAELLARFELRLPPLPKDPARQSYTLEGLTEPNGFAALCEHSDAQERQALPDGSESCVVETTGTLMVGGSAFRLGVLPDSYEHDGMYGQTYRIVIGLDAGPTDSGSCCRIEPVAVLTQWDHDVVDAFTEVTRQHQRVLDLDGDGVTELCVEEVREKGIGLLDIMDKEEAHSGDDDDDADFDDDDDDADFDDDDDDADFDDDDDADFDDDDADADNELDPADKRVQQENGKPYRWTPQKRQRQFFAYRVDPQTKRLVAAPTLSPECPNGNYREFIELDPYPDSVGWRAKR